MQLLPKIWLSSPHMSGNETKYVQDAFDANWIAPLGPNVDGLEKDIEKFLKQGNHVAILSSGTAALHLGLLLLGVKAGDEVICQSMTFSGSANPILYIGAFPILIDSEKDTWNLCPVTLEQAIIDRIAKGKRPKAIIAVHLYGMPFKVAEIMAISEKYKIPVLEDSAEALGSTYKGQNCGTFGQVGALSFNGNKIITTSGGGALVCKTLKHKEKAIYWATQSRDDAPHYQHSEIGYNYRMSNICAGIGRGQMEVINLRVSQRRAVNTFYVEYFKDHKEIIVFQEPSTDYFSNHWLSAIILNSFEQREALRLTLEKENIESRPLWKPVHLQPVFAQYPYYGNNISEGLFEKGLCLPSGSNLSKPDLQRIKLVLDSFFN
ncbi:DegT/DnrJ/EryC1/StrS family aminotransferase [Flavobacterium ardleyense]|uniref:DegT/DnrJ/EryC1/StrS family aminotransferase n=1 Tax=Flavobacterium ardleyense TaxID=2038737 RepID=A0ABW5Z5V9_9FLAO